MDKDKLRTPSKPASSVVCECDTERLASSAILIRMIVAWIQLLPFPKSE